MRVKYLWVRGVLAAVAAAGASGSVAAQDFNTVSFDVLPGRQIFETRLGGTSRVPPSGIPGSGLLSVVLIAGPTSGTTAIRGAFIDGGTLFAGGGGIPTYTNILTSGSAFSAGGGCQLGTVTHFPVINNNRPQLVTFNATTGLFSLTTPTIPGTDQFDAIDCAVATSDGVIFVASNRTDASLEVFRDNGSGFTPLNTIAAGVLETPFGGGLRPSIAIGDVNGDDIVDIAYMTNDGTVRVTPLDPTTGALGTTCPVFNSTPPTVFVKPRESAIRGRAGSSGRRIVTGDFNSDGTLDIAVVDAACGVQITSAPAGSANGGNGYNWTGVGIAQPSAEEPTNVLWGDYFYVRPDEKSAVDAPFASPFPGRGGPFHACTTTDAERGASYLLTGTAANNTQIQFSAPRRFLPQEELIFRSGLEPSSFTRTLCSTLATTTP